MLFYCAVLLSVLMLDEAHERTLYTDIAIGLLKKVTYFLLIKLYYLTFILYKPLKQYYELT